MLIPAANNCSTHTILIVALDDTIQTKSYRQAKKKVTAGGMTKDCTNKDRGTLKSCRQHRSRVLVDKVV